MKRKKSITRARLALRRKKTPEIFLGEIGKILNEAGVSKEEVLKALDEARREIYGLGHALHHNSKGSREKGNKLES